MRRIVLRELPKTMAALGLTVSVLSGHVVAQTAPPRGAPAPAPAQSPLVLPPDYVIGVEDILTIAAWRDPDLTADVIVRPDGKITLPILNDVQAAGLTPEQLRARLDKAISAVQEGAFIMVRVKEVKSRNVTVIGEVTRIGPVPLLTPMTVVEVLSRAGGFTEFANKSRIIIVRRENGQDRTFRFNYNEVSKGNNLRQNIELKPGDQVIVP
jgi:polysaccharide export outer membrane protein